jgi:kynurenine formamidase
VTGQFQIGGRTVRVDFSQGVSLAIPLDFTGPQPSHFGAPPATAHPMAASGFVGDTRQGGSCNVPIVTLNPHCNGTHTESVAHLVDESVPVHEAIPGGLGPATLITVTPIAALESGESYRPALAECDMLITAAMLKAALKELDEAWLQAVIIRTLPNGEAKRIQRYGEDGCPPFFSIEAVDYLNARGIHHLLVDLPSVDKMHDEGKLTVHHRFWQVTEGSHSLTAATRRDKTITEMTYVPDALADGPYLLALHVPAFCTDVAPSRPWLYPVEFV